MPGGLVEGGRRDGDAVRLVFLRGEVVADHVAALLRERDRLITATVGGLDKPKRDKRAELELDPVGAVIVARLVAPHAEIVAVDRDEGAGERGIGGGGVLGGLGGGVHK